MFKTIDSLLEFTNEAKFKRLHRTAAAERKAEATEWRKQKQKMCLDERTKSAFVLAELCQEQWS